MREEEPVDVEGGLQKTTEEVELSSLPWQCGLGWYTSRSPSPVERFGYQRG